MAEISMRILLITNRWPSAEKPDCAPFIAQQVRFLHQAGVDVTVLTFPGRMRLLNYVRAWRQVRKRIQEESFDLIHAHYGQCGLVCLPKRLPLVVTYHGSDLEGIIGRNGSYIWQSKILKLISRTVALRADQVIVVSESLGILLPHRCHYTVIPHGLDLDLFRIIPKAEARRILGFSADERLVLFSGSPDIPRERYPLAQQVIRLAKSDVPIRLVVVTGLPHEKIPLYMNACDVLLLTSIHESSPNMVKEALACNLPVVSVNVGDVRQRLRNIPGCVVCADEQAETIAFGLMEAFGYRGNLDSRGATTDIDDSVLAEKVIGVYTAAIRNRRRESPSRERS